MHIQQMKRCEKRERDRQRKWRNSKQGAFEASMLSLDRIISRKHCRDVPTSAEDDCVFAVDSWQSDGGKGAEDIIAACDACYELSYYACLKELARKRVERIDSRLLPVLELVFENGKNRKESIWQLMKMLLRKRRNGMRQSTGIGTI